MIEPNYIVSGNISDIESSIKGATHGATATIGLVVHSAADGVALGAAASTAHHDIEIIIFLAIMLHKVCSLIFFFLINPYRVHKSPYLINLDEKQSIIPCFYFHRNTKP